MVLPLFCLIGKLVQAQVSPDTSLGAETSLVTSQGNQDRITGGAARGNLLFHSFQELNVAAGRSLYFANPAGITQIFSRVTGNSPSNINGTLGVLGNADLFLLNPNGVVFGPNARLDLRGSFTATTAASVNVGGLEFSAVSPSAPPLLNLSVQPGIQWGAVASNSPIQNQGQLGVDAGRSLSLIGGQIEQVGTILAPGGIVTLQGERLSLAGNVDTRDGAGQPGILRLISPGDLQIQPTGPLTNGAINQALLTNGVVVKSDRDLTLTGPLRSNSSSPLTLQAGRDLSLLPGTGGNMDSSSLAGNVSLISGRDLRVENSLAIVNVQPYDLTLRAGGDVSIQQATLFINNREAGQGQLSLQAQNLRMTNGMLDAISDGPGNGANIVVQVAQDILLQGGRVAPDVPPDTSRIETSTNAQGNAGNVSVQAGGVVTLRAGEIGSYSGRGSGNSGDVSIEALQFRVDDRDPQLPPSQVRTTTELFTTGDGGDITIRARDGVELVGNTPGPFVLTNFRAIDLIVLAQTKTAITSSAFGSGKSGDITIATDRLVMRDGVVIGVVPGIFGTARRQQGNVAITASDTQLQGLAVIGSITLGATDAGNVTIQGDRLRLNDGAVITANSVALNPFAIGGAAGEVSITVNDLSVLNGSFLGAGTDTPGNGGQLTVNADAVTVAGVAIDGTFPSSLRTDVGAGLGQLDRATATGTGGLIAVNANQLRVLDGGRIIASTNSSGKAGDVEIQADRIEVRGSDARGIPSTVEARSTGTGAAGTIQIRGKRLTVDQGAQISTTTQAGNGGDIVLDVRDVLLLRDRGLISATAGQAGTGGDGGNIQIRSGFIVAPLGANSDITANAFEGNGGTIAIQTQGIFGLEFRPNLTPENDITASSEFGLNGTVNINILSLDPTRGLTQLPVNFSDAANQVDTSCDRLYKSQSRFVISGRGGLPPDPRQEWSASGILQDWREMMASQTLDGERRVAPSGSRSATIEATGWQMGSDNRIRLTGASHTGRTEQAKHSCNPFELGALR